MTQENQSIDVISSSDPDPRQVTRAEDWIADYDDEAAEKSGEEKRPVKDGAVDLRMGYTWLHWNTFLWG